MAAKGGKHTPPPPYIHTYICMNAAKRGNVMTLKTIAAYAEEPLELELDMHKELPAACVHIS